MQASSQRSQMLMSKLRLSRVVDVLKKQPAVLFEVEADLIQKGIMEPLVTTPVKETPMKMIENGDNTDYHDPEDPHAEYDDNDAFTRNTNKFCDLPFATLARAFEKAEPAIFTKANVKTMQVRGQRTVSIDSMLKLLEFLTDINKDDTIDKSIRTKRLVIDYIADLIIQKRTARTRHRNANLLHAGRTILIHRTNRWLRRPRTLDWR